jgi:glycosyltransferase involved in cell wall biosynthesis
MLALRADPKGLAALLLPVLLTRRSPSAYRMLPALVRYLREHQPDALISNFPFENLLAIAARRLAATDTALIVSEHNMVDLARRREAKWKRRFLPGLLRRQYPMADAIAAVSDGIAEDLAERTGLPRERIKRIYNPIVDARLLARARERPEHLWFRPEAPPIVLGAGRFASQKDFPTLVRAFARVRMQRPARLIILGQDQDGQHEALLALAHELGCEQDVSLPGYVLNPFAYMAGAAVFALSSRYEGFANVVAEALACGCPVVSTDCRSGPSEILAGGRYGRLVPVGDDAALAEAILEAIDQPGRAAGRRQQASMFSVERALTDYLRLIEAARAERPTGIRAALEAAG